MNKLTVFWFLGDNIALKNTVLRHDTWSSAVYRHPWENDTWGGARTWRGVGGGLHEGASTSLLWGFVKYLRDETKVQSDINIRDFDHRYR